LNWIENPLVATTGIGIGLGYITIFISVVVLLLSYLNKYENKRMILSFLSGMGLLLVALAAILIILTDPQARIGGGLYLTLVGAIVVAVYAVKEYANLTSRKRAATLAAGTIFLILLAPGIVVSGEVIYEYQKLQAEQDLRALEINQVSSYNMVERNTSVAEIEFTNPTSSEISVRVGFASNIPMYSAEVYQIPPEQTKIVEIEEDSETMIRVADIERGYEHRVECNFREIGYGDNGELGFRFTYDCSPGPGSLAILPAHEYYDPDQTEY